MMPVMAYNLLQSIDLLTSAAVAPAERCVGADSRPTSRPYTRHAEATLATATALNPYIGYDRAAEIVKEAASSGRPLRDVAREKGVEEATLDGALDLAAMARPHG